MNYLEKIIGLDCAYMESFTNTSRREWGVLFYDETQPLYYDANHAHIWHVVTNSTEVLLEIKEFYSEKKLTPRMYLYNVEQNQSLLNNLQLYGFQYEELQHPVQLWDGTLSTIPYVENIIIERVTDENYTEALEIECSIEEFGGRTVRESAFRN